MASFEAYAQPFTRSSEVLFGAASTTSPTAEDAEVSATTTTSTADCDMIDATGAPASVALLNDEEPQSSSTPVIVTLVSY